MTWNRQKPLACSLHTQSGKASGGLLQGPIPLRQLRPLRNLHTNPSANQARCVRTIRPFARTILRPPGTRSESGRTGVYFLGQCTGLSTMKHGSPGRFGGKSSSAGRRAIATLLIAFNTHDSRGRGLFGSRFVRIDVALQDLTLSLISATLWARFASHWSPATLQRRVGARCYSTLMNKELLHRVDE